MIFLSTNYREIIEHIYNIDPISYGKTRNFLNGHVTYLSPFVSRGVISTKKILSILIERGISIHQAESFIKELAWRDYFQRVWQNREVDMEIKQLQFKQSKKGMPEVVLNKRISIPIFNEQIHLLEANGYLHNHVRMYLASLICNIGQYHWKNPAKWMYYHLLDGDWASNACSWQWVCGANSGKMYLMTQENVAHFTGSVVKDTYLNKYFENPFLNEIPVELNEETVIDLKTDIPSFPPPQINPEIPTCIYNYYNLDPTWHEKEKVNRIILLEPDIFEKYPISAKCIDFMIRCGKMIPGIQFFKGSFQELMNFVDFSGPVYFKEHPLNRHYVGIEEPRDWMVPEIEGYYPSFFAYWKKILPYLKKEYA